MIRVVVADDQPLVRAGLRTLLETEPDIEVVAVAEDGAEAVERALALRPDVVCMDIRMPGRDGISATRELDILLHLTEGMSNEEIAQALVLEVSTVKYHLAQMMPKLGVKSRLQAAVWAYQSGLIER